VNLIITRDELTAIATRAKAIVAPKASSPVLGCVILDVTADGIDASAMQIGMGFEGQYTANVSERGRAAVPAADLLMAIKSLPVGPISMSLNTTNLRLTLSAGKSKATIGTQDPADHPGLAKVDVNARMTVAGPDLLRVINAVFLSMAESGSKLNLDGAYLDTSTAGMLRFVTTDGNRLAWSECPCSGNAPRKVFIPRAAIVEIRSMVEGFAGDVALAFDRNRAMIASIDGAKLTMNLAEVDFPEYRQVIPTAFKRSVSFDRQTMADTVKRLSVFDVVTLDVAFGEDGVKFVARKRDGGVNQGTAEMDAELTGTPITLGMSPRILGDALSSCSGESVRFQIGDALSPIILDNADDSSALFVIMPMRLE